jgi:2-methylcitrate dehydratase PrpD
MEIAREMAVKCLEIEYPRLSDAVIDRVKYLLLDHLGVTIRGAQSESSAAVQRFLKRINSNNRGVAVIGTPLEAEASLAALANGAAAHAPELDDVVNAASLHPGVCVIPASLSAWHLARSTGKDLIAAIVTGYEVMVKLGVALDPAAHYGRGFHPTGTCGVFGAAVAAARMLQLEEREIVHAVGISGSQSAGLLEFLADGSFTKRLHAGWAAHSGLIAALLAREGFSGPASVIEGKFGFLKAYSSASGVDKVLEDWGNPYAVMQTSIKPHACCRYKQGPIDCILEIVKENRLKPDDIEKVTAAVLKAGFALVAEPQTVKRNPKTTVDAQFSMPFGAAVAIVKGNAFLEAYCMENIASPEIRDMMARVECVQDPELETGFPRKWPAVVDIETRDGRRYRARLDYPKGDPENPLSWEELIDKFMRLTATVFPKAKSRKIVDAVRRLEHIVDISELMELLRK